MRCPNCNSQVDKDAEFCESCGTKLGIQKKPSQLPVVIICLVLFIAAVGGGALWVVSDEYHDDGTLVLTDSEDIQSAGEEKTVPGEAEDVDSGYTDADEKTEENETESEKDTADKYATKKEPAYDVTEGGIHRYEYVVSDCTWSEAYQNCLKAGGYLVRINSLDEYNYIINEIEQRQMTNIQFRIGGRRDSTSKDYYWVDRSNQLYGEKINADSYWTKEIWLTGEPSFSDGSVQEEYLDIFYYANETRWVLNDVPDDILSTAPEFSGKFGYICEYEE